MLEQSRQTRLNLHFPLSLWIPAVMFLGACHHVIIPNPGTFTATVNSEVVPGQATIAERGIPQAVAVFRANLSLESCS